MRYVMVLMLCQLEDVAMDDLKKVFNDFIKLLDAQCDVLKKNGQMVTSVKDPWRFYSPALDDENSFELLRAVIDAGRLTVEAETLIACGDETGAWRSLSLAQSTLLQSLSTYGKLKLKKIGNSLGGKSISNEADESYYYIFCIADDLISKGNNERGLAAKISKQLQEKYGIDKDENKVREIFNKQKHLLVNR